MALNQVTRGQLNAAIAAAAHKDLSNTDDQEDVTRYRQQGLAVLEAVEPWYFLRTTKEQALTAAQADYDLPTDFGRIAGDSMFYGGNNPITFFEQSQEIDRRIGPNWKLSSHAGGEVRFATIRGKKLWLAYKPNAAFVSANSQIVYDYYMAIDPSNSWADAGTLAADTTELNMPTWVLPFAVQAAQMFASPQEDDTNFGAHVANFRNWFLPEMRGYDHAVFSQEPRTRARIRQRGLSTRWPRSRYGN